MHCGRLGFEKNAEVVVEAFARFAEGRPGWQLHLLGEGPAAPYLRELIDRLGIAGQVRFEGFVSREHLAASYRAADIYATASTIETQGLVVLEAMASGTPVVGVNALAVPEMARHGRNGIMVEPYEPAEMAAAFALLADDDTKRERMGRACIGDVRAHELGQAIDGLERTYEELLASRGHMARE
jgi:glycosyltransferase involved in cell wall biosynthesis